MNVYLNHVDGISDAIEALFMSKRSWTREKASHIHKLCNLVNNREGCMMHPDTEYQELLQKVLTVGKHHITLLRYIDFSFTVEGLHRAGQDDWDAHVARYGNRIVRSSTRLAKFGYEMSDFYKNKVICTDKALQAEGIEIPDQIVVDGETFVKCINGYVKEEYKDDPDVLRGLYMESIPSNFIFRVNLTEFAHVWKLRNKNGGGKSGGERAGGDLCRSDIRVSATVHQNAVEGNRELK